MKFWQFQHLIQYVCNMINMCLSLFPWQTCVLETQTSSIRRTPHNWFKFHISIYLPDDGTSAHFQNMCFNKNIRTNSNTCQLITNLVIFTVSCKCLRKAKFLIFRHTFIFLQQTHCKRDCMQARLMQLILFTLHCVCREMFIYTTRLFQLQRPYTESSENSQLPLPVSSFIILK